MCVRQLVRMHTLPHTHSFCILSCAGFSHLCFLFARHFCPPFSFPPPPPSPPLQPALGEEAAQESVADLQAALVGADMVFITAGMGGGTG